VEGFEAEALAGLSSPVPALSVEFTTIQRLMAHACLAACEELGDYKFNAALGESQRLEFDRWVSAAEMASWIDALPHEANSGDIYAALANPGPAVAADRRAGSDRVGHSFRDKPAIDRGR
jgi:hypothetical protein